MGAGATVACGSSDKSKDSLEPHITSLKDPDFPSLPEGALSESEYDEVSDELKESRSPPLLTPLPRENIEDKTYDQIGSNGAGNIFNLFTYFHDKEMLGEAFKNNVTSEMRENNINAKSMAHVLKSDGSDRTDGARTPYALEFDDHSDEADMESDDGDDESESTAEIGQNILALMQQQNSGKGSKGPTQEQIADLKVLIDQKKKMSMSEAGSQFSFSQDSEYLLTPKNRPMIHRRETAFLIREGLKNDMTLPQEALEELADDPTMWLLNPKITSNIKTTADVARVMQHVESTINLIEAYIPNLKELLKDEKKAASYITNVIQELLKRAQKEGLLKRGGHDWTVMHGADLSNVSQRDIRKMVQAMAWTRNNVRAASVSDANDAKMASMGASEVKHSLKRLMSKTLSTRNLTYEEAQDLKDLTYEEEPIYSDPLFDQLDESEIHE